MRTTIIAVALLGLSGCSVVMASNKAGVDARTIVNCDTEACVQALRDTIEIGRTEHADGTRTVTYKALRKQGSTGRAVMHGLLDVATLGIWEVAGTPIEAGKNNDRFFIVETLIDADGFIIEAQIIGAS